MRTVRAACWIAALVVCAARPAFAEMTTVEDALTVVALGDSTTAGSPEFQSPIQASPEGRGNPESQYVYWMARRHPEWRVLNRGVGGERADEILRRFDRDVAAYHPRFVIILAGVNDLFQGEPTPRIIERLQRLYERAAQAGIRVVACTILPYEGLDQARRARLTEINGWIRDYSAKHGQLFCDLFSVTQDPKTPWRLAGSPDGLHPDVATYRKMGEALTGVIERWRP